MELNEYVGSQKAEDDREKVKKLKDEIKRKLNIDLLDPFPLFALIHATGELIAEGCVAQNRPERFKQRVAIAQGALEISGLMYLKGIDIGTPRDELETAEPRDVPRRTH